LYPETAAAVGRIINKDAYRN